MLQKNYLQALSYHEKACFANQNNAKSFQHWLIALYVNGQKEKALDLAKKRIITNPTELTTRALEAIIQDNWTGFTSSTRKF
jgi:tetratricopeptide (TPR) repeat protein